MKMASVTPVEIALDFLYADWYSTQVMLLDHKSTSLFQKYECYLKLIQ